MINNPLTKILQLFSFLLLVTILIGCTQEPVLWKINSKDQVISDYIASNPDQFSEFGKLLESAGLTNLLGVRGPYTLFLPNNEAMKDYYQRNHTSLGQMDKASILKLAYNHLILNEIHTGDIGLGALRDTNALGDYLVTEFLNSEIIINKQSQIVSRDIKVSNGIVHLIDRVIDPVTSNVYDQLASNPSYSLFTEGLKRTGLKDTLQVVYFPYGKRSARTRFTILAVPDTIYNRYGIHTIDDLISHYTNSPDSIKVLSNEFYRYMEYHCMGGTYFLSDFKTRIYPILSYDNNISIVIDNDYKLNYNLTTRQYTRFDIANSNVTSKNGAIHSISDLLPVVQPEPSVIVFETTDYFDIKQGDYYGKYYMKWDDGQNTFSKIKWQGDYLQYYYKNHDAGSLLNYDCLNMNGFWWVEITTPKIMKGNYRLTGSLSAQQVDYKVYVDGVETAMVKKTDPDKITSWGEFEWDKTQEHKIKVANTTWGLLFWDTVIFTPIK